MTPAASPIEVEARASGGGGGAGRRPVRTDVSTPGTAEAVSALPRQEGSSKVSLGLACGVSLPADSPAGKLCPQVKCKDGAVRGGARKACSRGPGSHFLAFLL